MPQGEKSFLPRRIRARAPIAVLALVTVGIVVGALTWRTTYEPLSFDPDANIQYGDRLDSGVEYPGGLLAKGITIGPGLHEASEWSRPGPMTASPSYDEDVDLSYGLSLHNTGPVGVTILGLQSSSRHLLLSPSDVRLGRRLPNGESSIVDTEPMTPFTLAGGESRSLVLRMEFSDCEWFTPGFSQTFVAWEVRYRVLGLTKTAALELPVQVHVEAPRTCPREDRTGALNPPTDSTSTPPETFRLPSD